MVDKFVLFHVICVVLWGPKHSFVHRTPFEGGESAAFLKMKTGTTF